MIELNERTIEPPYYKFINKSKWHYNMNYKLGLNENVEPFNPSGECSKGGLYFTDKNNIVKFYTRGEILCEITLCEDSKVWYEDDKAKTNKFIITNMYNLSSNNINKYTKIIYDLTKSFNDYYILNGKYNIYLKYTQYNNYLKEFNVNTLLDIINTEYYSGFKKYFNKCIDINNLSSTEIDDILNNINNNKIYRNDMLKLILQRLESLKTFNNCYLNILMDQNNLRKFLKHLKLPGVDKYSAGKSLIKLCKIQHTNHPEMVKAILRKFDLHEVYLNKALYEICRRDITNDETAMMYRSCKYYNNSGYPSIIYMLIEAGATVEIDINEIRNETAKKILISKKII